MSSLLTVPQTQTWLDSHKQLGNIDGDSPSNTSPQKLDTNMD